MGPDRDGDANQPPPFKDIDFFSSDAALREKLGRCGTQFVRENFSVEKMVVDQYSVYQQLAAQRGLRA